MLRAMDSAVSGLRAHQNKLDVIGHNIANVNTVGYKSQSYTFKDTMYQSSTASTNGTATAGGVNAAQYGYGSLMGTISMDMTASTPTYVGGFSATIDGDGFFVTKSTKLPTAITTTGVAAGDTEAIKNADFDYTRVGQFKVDSNGFIVDGQGNFVYGYRSTDGQTTNRQLVPLRIPQTIAVTSGTNASVTIGFAADTNVANDASLQVDSIKINKMGNIEATLTYVNQAGTGTNTEPESGTFLIGTVAVVTFQNQEGLTKDGSNYYKASSTDNTGVCSADTPGTNRATLMPGYLEASNVDMAVEFSEMIMAERGFQANSKIITVSDEILNELINMKR
ncbi:MAG TPA: flagellar hook-basal body protein [Lachnospiraceae bacterium]|nr:flagellar hook-basal body protein [Lachnospiraceae bacterium]